MFLLSTVSNLTFTYASFYLMPRDRYFHHIHIGMNACASYYCFITSVSLALFIHLRQ